MRQYEAKRDRESKDKQPLSMAQTWRKAASYTVTPQNKIPLLASLFLTLAGVAMSLVVPMLVSRVVASVDDDDAGLSMDKVLLLAASLLVHHVINNLRDTANTHVLKHTQDAVIRDVDKTMLTKWDLAKHMSTTQGDKAFMVNKSFAVTTSISGMLNHIVPTTLKLMLAAAVLSKQYGVSSGLQLGFMLLATLANSRFSSQKIVDAEAAVMTEGAGVMRELMHNANSYKAIHDAKQASSRHDIAAKANQHAAAIYAHSQTVQQASERRYMAIAAGFAALLLYSNREAFVSSKQLLTFMAYLAEQCNSLHPFGKAIDGLFGAYPNLNFVMSQLSQPSRVVDDFPQGRIPASLSAPSIDYRDVHYGYSDTPVLRGISFDVKPGETLALVSESGGGKSTVFNLLYRYFQAEGDIRVNGKCIDEIGLTHLRDHISVIGQEPLLFSGSVRENICAGSSNPGSVSDRRVVDLADRLGLREVIHDIGLDKQVGEGGAQLSGGQRQKVAILRSLLEPRPIILMDEITAALDAGSAKRVLRGIDALCRDHTVMMITHKLKEAEQYCDRIVVMQCGQVAAQGSHADLMAAEGGCELYQSLYMAQQSADAISTSPARV